MNDFLGAFTQGEKELITTTIKENPGKDVYIRVTMNWVSCSVGGVLIVDRKSYYGILLERVSKFEVMR